MELTSRQRHLLTILNEYKLYLILPTFVGAFLAVAYVFVLRSQNWTTRQRLLIRDDLLGQSFKPGQFSSFDTMKLRQETILDIARNTDVIRNTLTAVGPPTKSFLSRSDEYPSVADIEGFQGQVSLSAPNGAEFGTTEIVVLSVRASKSERSQALIAKLLDEIERKAEEVRHSQLMSMEAELQAARDNAKTSLQESINQLREMETILGVDSITMANMTSSMPGDNSVKSEILQIQAEKRGFEAQLESLETSLKTLKQAESNPLLIVSSSSSFFRDQIKLAELAKSLVESQKTLAAAAGKYQDAHPQFQHASEQLNVTKRQIADELVLLNESLNSQIKELQDRIQRLGELIENNHVRLKLLNEKRGEHLAINAEITKRNEMLNQIEATLKTIQSYRNEDGNTVWITRVGLPQPSSQPDGLSKRATVVAGAVLGFLFGAGLVVLLAPPFPENPSPDSRPEHSAQLEPRRAAPNRNAVSSSRSPAPLAATEPSFAIPFAAGEAVPTSKMSWAEASVQNRDSKSNPANQPTSSIRGAGPIEPHSVEQGGSVLRSASPRENKAPATDSNKRLNPSQSEPAASQLNIRAARQEETNADELLAELRAQRARQTDPLTQLRKALMEGTQKAEGQNAAALFPPTEATIYAETAHIQQSVGKHEPLEAIQQGIQARPKNLFLTRSGNRSSSADGVMQSLRKTNPDEPTLNKPVAESNVEADRKSQ